MRVLFAISALCLLALVGAGLAIRRHILAAARKRARRETVPSHLELVEAELHRDLRAAHAEKGFFRGTMDKLSASARASATQRDSAIHQPAHTAPAPLPPTANAPMQAAASRKPPASLQSDAMERQDWAHFNQDFGDLSDPYQSRRHRNTPRSATSNRR